MPPAHIINALWSSVSTSLSDESRNLSSWLAGRSRRRALEQALEDELLRHSIEQITADAAPESSAIPAGTVYEQPDTAGHSSSAEPSPEIDEGAFGSVEVLDIGEDTPAEEPYVEGPVPAEAADATAEFFYCPPPGPASVPPPVEAAAAPSPVEDFSESAGEMPAAEKKKPRGLDISLLNRLRDHFRGRGTAEKSENGELEGCVAHAAVLGDIRSRLGSLPDSMAGEAAIQGELAHLRGVTAAENMSTWKALTAEDRIMVLSLITARLRYIDECNGAEHCIPIEDFDKAEKTVIVRLANHAHHNGRGSVNGLAYSHRPRHGLSWRDDVLFWQNKFLRTARRFAPTDADVAAEIANLPRKPKHKSSEYSDTRETKEFVRRLPDDWPWGELVRNSRILIVGGDKRDESHDHARTVFGPDLEWVITKKSSGSPRLVQDLAKSIRCGSRKGLLILLKDYMDHATFNRLRAAAKLSSASWQYAIVKNGYGTEQIRAAIEEQIEY